MLYHSLDQRKSVTRERSHSSSCPRNFFSWNVSVSNGPLSNLTPGSMVVGSMPCYLLPEGVTPLLSAIIWWTSHLISHHFFPSVAVPRLKLKALHRLIFERIATTPSSTELIPSEWDTPVPSYSAANVAATAPPHDQEKASGKCEQERNNSNRYAHLHFCLIWGIMRCWGSRRMRS